MTDFELGARPTRFSRVTDAIGLGIWYCDLPFDELVWNHEVKGHFFLPPDARVTIETFYERIHPDDRQRTRERIEQSIATRAPYDIEYRTVADESASRTKWIRAIGWADYDSNGQPVRFDGITIDVTDTKKRDAALLEALRAQQEATSVLRTINESNRNLSAELELDRLVQKVTDAATTLSKAKFGALFYNVTKPTGESYVLYTISGAPREAFAQFPMPRNTQIFAPTFKGEGVMRSDDITKDPRYGKNSPHHGMPAGHLPVRSYLAVPVITRSGEVVGGLFFGHPEAGIFTEREEEIVLGLAAQAAVAIDNARLFDKAREAVRLRDDFLSVASHELRTPLTSLMLQTQMRARAFNRADATVPDLATLQRQVENDSKQIARLASLVDDMLDIARIRAGRLVVHFEEADLVAIVEDVLEKLAAQIDASTSAVTVERQLESVPGHWDRARLDQVVTNVMTNALKYGAGKPVHVTVGADSQFARVTVRDHGRGIEPQHHKRIFERFERAVDTNEVSGLGLGLFIASRILESHDGRILVESTPGQGSVFTIEVPFAPAPPKV